MEDPTNIYSFNSSRKPEEYSIPLASGLSNDKTPFSRSVSQITFHQLLSVSRNFDEFSAKIEKILLDLGFVQYSFARLNITNEIPRPLITMPHEMSDIYFREAFYEHDLTLQYAMNDNGPIFHSVIEDYVTKSPFITDAIKQNREIFKLLKSYGFNDFYFIPLGAHNGNGRVFLAVAARDQNLKDFQNQVEKSKMTLHMLAEAIDYIGTRKYSEFFLGENESRDIVIHPKPLILINTLVKGDLTLAQTADKLGISVPTADKHIAAVKEALGTNTTAGAIYKAMKSGPIDYH